MAKLFFNKLLLKIADKILIQEFTHQFDGGTIIALVGDNGCGKTTLLKTIAGLIDQNEGHIFIDEKNLHELSPKKRAQSISLLLQHSPEQPYCTARTRIAHGLIATLGYQHFLNVRVNALVEETATNLMIEHLLDRKCVKMSGGEQRLVHIAKCMINRSTQILLLDEPSVFLDFSQQNNLIKNLHQKKAAGQLIIFSSHDRAFIERTADVVVMIKDQRFMVTNAL